MKREQFTRANLKYEVLNQSSNCIFGLTLYRFMALRKNPVERRGVMTNMLWVQLMASLATIYFYQPVRAHEQDIMTKYMPQMNLAQLQAL